MSIRSQRMNGQPAGCFPGHALTEARWARRPGPVIHTRQVPVLPRGPVLRTAPWRAIPVQQQCGTQPPGRAWLTVAEVCPGLMISRRTFGISFRHLVPSAVRAGAGEG